MSVEIPVKIFTNDGEDHFFGFDENKAELTLVFMFVLQVSAPDLEKFPKSSLEWLFQETAIGETTGFAKLWRGKGLRSISVGDVVLLGETAFACESIGWKTISTDQLLSCIIADDTEEGEK